jgi:DNA polymerase
MPARPLPAALDGPALVQAVAACQACQLCSGRRAPVFGRPGAPQPADWLVLGEPPDEEEERAGTAFAGQVGQLLDNMLRAVGLTRVSAESAGAPASRAYLSNVVKCRPAVVRIPQPQELLACEPFLQRELALVKPRVILAMGRFAAQVLLQGSHPEAATLPLGKLRGQTFHYQGVPVIVTYHPGYLLRSQADKARAWLDLCRARAVVLGAASDPARGP